MLSPRILILLRILVARLDAYVSAYEVAEGRPYPYMIHRLMERVGVMDVRRVCKVGDSVRDMEEGRNAGCGLVVGVTSGADSGEDLMASRRARRRLSRPARGLSLLIRPICIFVFSSCTKRCAISVNPD